MKVKVEVDCTPEEARTFLGLPDVQPMQAALMKDFENRLRANFKALDPEVVMKSWFPVGLEGADQLQKMFWSQVQQTMSGVAQVTTGISNLSSSPKTKNQN